MTDSNRAVVARSLVQQCLHGRLQVKPPTQDTEAEWVEIQRGMVIYICFFKGATEEIIPKIVSTLLNVKLCETETGRYVSVLDLPGNVLIVPQATLGGKAKGKSMQYHANFRKEEGMLLYASFVAQCEKSSHLPANALNQEYWSNMGPMGIDKY